MQSNNFTITGNITDRQSKQGISGLRIEAWDKDLFFDDMVGSAETDAEGLFKIRFNEDHFRELFERRPDLYFRLYSAEEAISGESFEITVTPPSGKSLTGPGDLTYWNLAPGQTHVSISLSIPVASHMLRVEGAITHFDSKPVVGVTVKAVDKDLRHEEELGTAITNQAGEYKITYSPQQFYRAEKKSADLLVRTFDEQGQVLASSAVLFNAPVIAKINLTVNAGLSEFERITEALASLLKIDNVNLTELDEEDIGFLAGETGFNAQWLQILADAARVASQVDFGLSEGDETAFFYGLGQKGQPMILDELLSKDFYILRKVLEDALDENIIPASLSTSLDAIFEILDQLAEQIAEGKPIYFIDVQQKRLRSIGDLIGLEPAKINLLINRAVTFSGINDATLGSLLEEGELLEPEAKELGLAVSLYHLLDADIQLVEVVKTGSFPQLPQGNVTDVIDLVALDKTDWFDMLSQVGITPPNDLTLEKYAAILCKKIEILYPSDALMARLIRLDDETVRADLERLQPLFENNKKIIRIDKFDSLNIPKSQADEIKTLKNSHASMVHYVNRYRGFKLEDIIDNQQLSADDKAIQIGERVGLLSQFHAQNSDKEFLTLDYSPDSVDIEGLQFDGFSDDEQQRLLSCIKAYQRVYSIAEDIEQSLVMMAAGYDSAWSITGDSQQGYQANTGMSVTTAESNYQSAVATVENTTTKFGTVLDLIHGGYTLLDVANQWPEINDYLKQIEGFEELFGSQDYCKCQHCQSILSPAAYFVDLMSFVENKILSINFAADLENHVLNLKVRRADLWTLPLNCENTHGLTPYLDIINEILENYIYITGQEGAVDELPDRDEIEEYVYKNVIKESVLSFQQPVLLPLEKLEIYLSHFDVTRGEIASLLEKEPDVIAAAALRLSSKEYELVTQVKDDIDFLTGLYGIAFEIDADSGSVEKFDVQYLLSPIGLTRSELGELVETKFVQSSSSETIHILGEKINDQNSVQNDVEKIHGLTTTSLDYMHRFVRLWRQLSWSISELDLVVSHLQDETLCNGIDGETVLHVATLLKMQNRFGISVEELCTLWSDIPHRKISGSEQALFDRLFNLADFVLMAGPYPKISDKFTHPAFQQIDLLPNENLHRLLAGLRIDDEQLYLLILHLSVPLGLVLDPEPAELYEPGFYLTLENLSLLYRHARLAQFLKLKISELFKLIAQAPLVDSGSINSLHDLSAFLNYYDWWKLSGYSIEDISNILAGKDSSDVELAAQGFAQQLKEAIRKEGALTFADTIFAYLQDITEQQSKTIIATNSGWIAGVPDSSAYWLTNSFDPAMLADTPSALTFSTSIFSTLKGVGAQQSRLIVDENPSLIEKIEVQIPGGRMKTVCRLTNHFNPDSVLVISPNIDVYEADARSLLIAYYDVAKADISSLLLSFHASEVVPTYLSGIFSITADKVKSLASMTEVDLSSADFVTALQSAEPAAERLINLLARLLPLNTLFNKKVFDADAINFITDNQDNLALFKNVNFNSLLIENIQRVSLYGTFVFNAAEQSSFEDLKAVLLAFDANHEPEFPDAVNSALASVLKAELGVVLTLKTQLQLPATALEALEKLLRCTDLIKYLGVGSEALSLLVSEDYKEFAQASDAILGVFRAKYHDEKEWEEKVAPYENKIRTIKRNALTDFMIHSDEYAWCRSQGDLYYYFLVDAELEGCAQTSRVVAAISSLQLYVHRVLMNLEQSETGGLQVKPDEPEEFKKEWEWRKNYRVWEANRKVFLYPENWIEPGLRDNKTPLFETLESELLQQEINEQTVLDAYANYMRGFDEVSHLKIAGSYHGKDEQNKKDILHLFGVTADEPPIYYYRGIENAHFGERESNRGIVWSPWRKIDVQIPVSKVSPIIFRGRLHIFWVEYTTRPKNEVKDGSSEFVGYQHKMSLKYTSLLLDGSWTTPQRISLYGVDPFDNGDGVIDDPLKLTGWFDPFPVPELDYDFETGKHYEPKDGYTLTGYSWDQIYPAVYVDEEGVEQLVITGRDWELNSAPVDFYKRTIKQGRESLFPEISWNSDQINWGTHQLVYSHIESEQRKFNFFRAGRFYRVDYAYASIFIDNDRVQSIKNKCPSLGTNIDLLLQGIGNFEIGHAHKESQLSAVNGSIQDVSIDLPGDLLLLSNKPQMGHFWLRRLGTTLSEQVARTLLTKGVNGLLDIEMQKALIEKPSPIEKNGDWIDDSYLQKENTGGKNIPDFSGSLGGYYREIFFHIPFLIANHLNSQQKFSAAQKWYHYIFDPTATEEIEDFGAGPTPDPEEVEKRQRDRNWRYIEFRNFDVQKLRDLLTDSKTIEVYRKDPFNPHAIARLRLTAYQKTIIMKYIDNLLDWGDQLFVQDTMESINEATLLYILASDILGERPAELGECAEISVASRTYESIKPLLNEDSPFLIEMEHLTGSNHAGNFASELKDSYDYAIDPAVASNASASAQMTTTESQIEEWSMAARMVDDSEKGTQVTAPDKETDMMLAPDILADSEAGVSTGMDWNNANQVYEENQARQWQELVRQITSVFCVPENKGLKQYWDRVDDRLYKIRNCMNISGMRRQLSLFAPEIDPGLLVRAKAAGLSVEDVLNAISGNLPPYRFAYVIEKAKSYAATLQGFGAALLSALEKKDVEELTLLRTLHEQNIMKMSKQVKQWEIDAADESIEGLKRRKETVQHRRDYFKSLIDEGLIPWENTQQISQHGASVLRGMAAVFNSYGAIAYLVPQVGSPFAMKYGGKEVGDSGSTWSDVFSSLAGINEAVAASAGLEASYHRRSQGWEHQAKQAEHELKELERQIKGAEIHKDLTTRSLEVHEKSLDQLNEVYEFFSDKFSNLGLYTWLSTTLQRLYREAYNSAYAMAKLAEQTYRFERSDDTSELLGSGHWEAPKAGLLAGERLSIDLLNLERKFIETNYRSLEINQSFSLSQIAPIALIQLRETGECEFEIAEIFFDLFYPGHYRRRIKSARMSIPCVTGPYTNVSATLRLTGSSIRVEPEVEDELKPVPRTRTLSIATSSAQNDAGVFELNFRDERYMPFEGAGSISNWSLALPKNFRQFDYQTISDVLIHISYTAEEDGLLLEQVEASNAQAEGAILEFLSENCLSRVFSLAHDFSSEYHRLIHSPVGYAMQIKLTEMHLPIFLQGRDIEVSEAKLCLQVPEGQGVDGFQVKINDITFSDITSDDQCGGLPTFDIGSIFTESLLGEYNFVIEDAGELSSEFDVDPDKLEDILLSISYKIKKGS